LGKGQTGSMTVRIVKKGDSKDFEELDEGGRRRGGMKKLVGGKKKSWHRGVASTELSNIGKVEKGKVTAGIKRGGVGRKQATKKNLENTTTRRKKTRVAQKLGKKNGGEKGKILEKKVLARQP